MNYKFELVFDANTKKWYNQIINGEEKTLNFLGPYYDAREAYGCLDKDFRKWWSDYERGIEEDE